MSYPNSVEPYPTWDRVEQNVDSLRQAYGFALDQLEQDGDFADAHPQLAGARQLFAATLSEEERCGLAFGMALSFIRTGEPDRLFIDLFNIMDDHIIGDVNEKTLMEDREIREGKRIPDAWYERIAYNMHYTVDWPTDDSKYWATVREFPDITDCATAADKAIGSVRRKVADRLRQLKEANSPDLLQYLGDEEQYFRDHGYQPEPVEKETV